MAYQEGSTIELEEKHLDSSARIYKPAAGEEADDGVNVLVADPYRTNARMSEAFLEQCQRTLTGNLVQFASLWLISLSFRRG